MMLGCHVLDHVPDYVSDHVSDHMIIGLVATALQHKQKKLRDRSHYDTSDIWHFKKLCFWKNLNEVLNQLNSASWAELEDNHVKSHIKWLYVKVIMDITNENQE